MKIVKAKLKEDLHEFEEEFEIPDNKTPKDFIEYLLDIFNAGRNKKYIRHLISISEPIKKEGEYDWNAVLDDCYKFLVYCRRQNDNAYGNRGVKDDYKKIEGAYSKFIRGIYGNFCSLVREHRRSAYDDLTLLGDLSKDQYKEIRKKYKNKINGNTVAK